MTDLIAELLLLFEELKFRKKKKKRRKPEQDKNLPKKTMIHPVVRIFLIGLFLILVFKIVMALFSPDPAVSRTVDKMTGIAKILEKEKRDLGSYPLHLEAIIRNNPLRKNITLDAWGNAFFYKQSDNGLAYELRSKGKDGILNTEDDVVSSPER